MFHMEVILLALVIRALDSTNRTKRQIDEQIIGGVIPAEPVKSAVCIFVNERPTCSGTVLSNTWVLSAAHCFEDVDLEDIEVVAGVMKLFSKEAVKSAVKAKRIHPKYKRELKKELDWDLALLELQTSLEIDTNTNIENAVLPPPAMKYTNRNIQVGGWGLRVGLTGHPASRDYFSIDIHIKTIEACLDAHGVGFFPDRMFCAGRELETTCRGDSGAGAIRHIWRVPVLLGVVSFGKPDCRTASVFTKIENSLPWILKESNLRPYDVLSNEGDYEEYLQDVSTHCSDVTLMPNILFLSDTKLVRMPSFQTVKDCSVPKFPGTSALAGAVNGIVDKKLVICGGPAKGCHFLDNGIWHPQQSSLRRNHAAASSSPAGLLVTGGRHTSSPGWHVKLSSTKILTNKGWASGPSMPVRLYDHCQISRGSMVIVTGGFAYRGKSSEVYSLEGKTWTPLQPMKNGRYSHACSIHNNDLIVLGGAGASISVEKYNFAEKTWTTGTSLPTSMIDGVSVVFDGKLYAVYGNGMILRLEENLEAWIELANIGEWRVKGARPFPAATVVSRDILNC